MSVYIHTALTDREINIWPNTTLQLLLYSNNSCTVEWWFYKIS